MPGLSDDDLNKIHESFAEALEELPDSMEGLSNLVAGVFWQLVALGRDNPDTVSPVNWADRQVHGWVRDFFVMHELGLSLEEEHGSDIQRLRTFLVGQASLESAAIERASTEPAVTGQVSTELAPIESEGGASRRPLLRMIEEEGAKLRSAKVRDLIRNGFHLLASQVFQARTALLNRGTARAETFRSEFPELSPLTPTEAFLLFREIEPRERSLATARLIAAQLIENRCGLVVGTVLKYAQPAKPGPKDQKENER